MKKLNEDTSKIEKEIMINKILDKLICNRGISKDKAIKKYLNGGIPDLYYPYLMKGMKQAGELILQKIKEKKRIRIIGDYDVDGVMSSYILHACLKRLGAICDVMIPHRIKDGYGLNGRLVCQSYLDGVDTIITCDNGITSITWVEIIKKLGMTVVITDHHDIQYSENKDGTREYILPPADVVINPKQPGCLYPFKGLCGAGVAWKLVCYLYEKAEIPREERYKFLEFVCLATVSDVMDLTDENRILVKEGLKYLKNTENLGIRELISKNCLYQYNIDVDDIAFTLGPCLNASGRLDTAELSLELIETDDKARAKELASRIKDLNENRKRITTYWMDKTIKLVESTSLKDDKVLVIYLPECNESIAGIVAGRLKEHYNKPVFVLTNSTYGLKGSGRSIESYKMYDEICKCKEYLTNFGGHQMAAGVSFADIKNLKLFKKRINELCKLTDKDLIRKVDVDMEITLNNITKEFVECIDELKPFGKGNPKPSFMSKNLQVLSPRIIGKNKNAAKMVVVDEDGYKIDAVYFGDATEFVNYVSENKNFEFVYYPQINRFMGRKNLQITITSYK